MLFSFVIVVGCTLVGGALGMTEKRDEEIRQLCSTSDMFFQCKNVHYCSRYIDDLRSVCQLVRSLNVQTPGYIETIQPTSDTYTQPLPNQSTSNQETSTPEPTTSPFNREYNYGFTSQPAQGSSSAGPDNSVVDTVEVESRRGIRIPASIVDPPLNITVPPGAVARFSCKSAGAPAPLTTITRRNDDVESPNHEKVPSERETIVSVIQEIENVNVQNEGWYRCIASNAWGVVYRDAYLSVKDLCVGLECGKGEVCEADYLTGTAECACKDCGGFPYNITCGTNCKNYFNACSLDRDNCRDGTDVGVLREGYCPRVVTPVPHTSAGDELYFSEGEKLQVTCTVSSFSNPPPELYWVKEDENGRETQVSDSAILRIRNLEADDEGTYRCEARQCLTIYRSEEVFVVVEEDQAPDNLVAQKSVCTVFGDPHFLTFDGLSYDYMGECDYVLAMDCLYASWLIYGRTEKCSRNSVTGSCLSSVTVFSGASAVELQRGWIINHQGNKMNITDGGTLKTGPMTVSFDGRNLRLLLEGSGVEVVWDGLVSVHILVPMGTNTCGLCGNNDFNPTNDLLTRGGVLGTSVAIGDSWAVDRYSRCENNLASSNQRCVMTSKRLAAERCEAAFKAMGLSRCSIDNVPYIAGCVADVCTQNWIADRLAPECIAVSTYVERCALDGVRIWGWEESVNCPPLYRMQDIIVSEGCPQDVERLLRRKAI